MINERMAAYGVDAPMRAIELDHLVSLEPDGAPEDARNLWPEPWDGPLGTHVKDRLEDADRRLVCAGKLPLAEAQQKIVAERVRFYWWMQAKGDTE
jgi:hypothetical protein